MVPGIVYLQNSGDVPPVGSKLTATWSFKLSRYILGVQPVSPISYFSSETKYPNEDNPVHMSHTCHTASVEIFRLKAPHLTRPWLPASATGDPSVPNNPPTASELQRGRIQEWETCESGEHFLLDLSAELCLSFRRLTWQFCGKVG